MGDTVEWCHYTDRQRHSARVLRLAGRGRELSAQARRRLKWMDYYESHGHNARLTCRYFGISPQTFYRWRRRYDPQNLRTLEDRSRRPRRRRQPTWSPELAQAVLRLRERRLASNGGIRLFVLPPRSPKLNGHVERADRTHAEEFYEVADLPWSVAELNQHALAWERVYNTVRPHQALGDKTPKQFLEELALARPP